MIVSFQSFMKNRVVSSHRWELIARDLRVLSAHLVSENFRRARSMEWRQGARNPSSNVGADSLHFESKPYEYSSSVEGLPKDSASDK